MTHCLLYEQVTRSEKVSVKDTMDKPDKVVKKPDMMKEKSRSTTTIENKPEPISLPSFPFGKVS